MAKLQYKVDWIDDRYDPHPFLRLKQSKAAKDKYIYKVTGKPKFKGYKGYTGPTSPTTANGIANVYSSGTNGTTSIYMNSNSATTISTPGNNWIHLTAAVTNSLQAAQNQQAQIGVQKIALSHVPVGTITNATPGCSANTGIICSKEAEILDGLETRIKLADGAYLDVKGDGSYQLVDKDAKVTYRANRTRDFNSFLNASDKLESFIAFCGQHGVKQNEMLELPINLFIAWLVIESAKADQEPVPDIPLLPDLRKKLNRQCTVCKKFLSKKAKQAKLVVCSSVCFDKQMELA